MTDCETNGHIWDGRVGGDFSCEKCGAPYSPPLPRSAVAARGGVEGYIAVVPDHCDTIAWRGAYHALAALSSDTALHEGGLRELLREAREAADDVLAPLCEKVGRYLYDEPETDAVDTMHGYEVAIPFRAFKRLYDATDKETIDAALSGKGVGRG